MHGPQQNVRAHGVRQSDRRAIGKIVYDLVHEDLQVGIVLAEIADVRLDPDYEYRLTQSTSFRSIIGVPILREKRVIGVFVLAEREPGGFARRRLSSGTGHDRASRMVAAFAMLPA